MLRYLLVYMIVPLSAFAMTLEEKIGQLLIVHFNGKKINEEARVLISDVGVSGIIYYTWANGLESPEQIRDLSYDLQAIAHIPLFIGVDQEGGRVTRLKNGFTQFPDNAAVGMTQMPQYARLCAQTMGEELAAVGINLNFAPVVDVNCNPKNPVIGTRAFSADPQVVALFGRQALAGYKQANILACLKHFPGHGDVSVDPHVQLPYVDKSREELWDMELYPYRELLSQADMVMTAHILFSAYDPDQCATFSSIILQDLLRGKLGFSGVVISDSLIMQGLLEKGCSIEEATLRAFNAGCDLLLLGGKQLIGRARDYELTVQDVQRIHQYLIAAVKDGRLSEERIDASLSRILLLKEKISKMH